MGRHQAPDAPGRDPALAPSPVPDPRPGPEPAPPPTYRSGSAPRLTDALTPIARPAPPGTDGSAPGVAGPGADPEATTVLRLGGRPGTPPVSGPPAGATRADLITGGPAGRPFRPDLINGGPAGRAPQAGPVHGGPPRADLNGGGPGPVGPYQTDYNTGTFSRVLLTGLGGSAEPAAAEVPAPRPVAPGARDRAVATTRRLAARVAALRGDERTALLAVGAVVGIVLLMLAILVVVVRLASGSDASPAAAPGPSPVASQAPVPTPAASESPTPDPEPTGSPLPPSGGSFTSRHSNLCLGVPQGRTDDGAQLVQRTCGTDFGTGFLLVGKDQPGAYELVNTDTSRCADVLNASMDDGAPVAQWECNGGLNQTFQLRPLTDTAGADTGYVQIVAAHSGKCLDVTNASPDENAPIQQATCRDPVAEIEPAAGNQSWLFTAS